MKWKAPQVGDIRVIKRFAFLPITGDVKGEDRRETRWLCFVKLHQRYVPNYWLTDRIE